MMQAEGSERAARKASGCDMAKKRTPKSKKPERDEAREERISMEIVVDAYDEEEQMMGWCAYLEETLEVPFRARCVKERAISPLKVGDEVDVVGFASDECGQEMFVEIPWEGKPTLAVPLSQLDVVRGTKATRQAVEDWHYWVGKY
jgi:Calcium binding